ncbi:uncharacterized protein TRIVIDRAFT_31324 [Trichoderma virens Gv29-8]|uniref:Uncharacterized protein n=1 Tax=Hypocrea virens (strain Gv29-8 / FGSC 10586) TaxID=413071 RepID=G9MLI3_HYPVG|nr:uncharacterized protein TRIVIDRAFT_31324 [Trichoderma virens Gv29-8]EHK24232.1 hypothetical protein TRIVIDRAFT_31324 [Trichoderma virens Gv29-8]
MQEPHAIGVRPNGRPQSFHVNHDSRKPLFGRPEDNNENGLHLYTARTPGFSRIGMGASANVGGDNNATALRKPRPISENFTSTRDQANANANSSVLSSGGTRIPRLNSLSQTRRKPISLRKAMELAEGEEEAAKLMLEAGLDDPVAVEGSPSPAPRPWRMRTASEVSEMQRVLGADHLDTKGRSKIPSARNSNLSATLVGGREGAISPARASGATRLNGSDGLMRQRSTEDATATTASGTSGLPELVPGIEDIPLTSIDPALSAATLVQRSSPDKSFAWQMDEDFTEGELQISDSPRVRVGTRPFASRLGFREDGKQDFDSLPRLANPGSRNNKLDEIRSLELRTNGSQIPLASPARLRPPNTKLDDIRTRESQVERQIPLASRHLDGLRNNTKIDDIRQREADGVSKRAFAAARLQEIKEQNSMARPRSPDEESKPRPTFGLARRRLARQEAVDEVKKEELPPLLRPRTSFGGAEAGRQIRDTPVTIFSRDVRRVEEEVGRDNAALRFQEPEKKLDSWEQKWESLLAKPKAYERQPDDRELLRRLARAASASPPPEDEPRTKQLPTPPPGDEEVKQTTTKSIADRIASRLFSRRASTGDKSAAETTTTTTATTTDIKDSEKSKPTVGFTGLQRSRSVESAKSKRSSMQSEPDPTARIEAEMKLFAPSDNQSERGSIRAPSPPPDDSDEGDNGLSKAPALELTPKPSKPDPLSMPTPRVTGAYVETPVSIKTEKLELKPELPAPKLQLEGKAPVKTSAEPPAPLFRDRKPSFSSWRSKERSQDQDTASDPGTTDDGGDIALALAAAKKPRAKSLPRRRPPMKNSARPPSAKDDLMELRREYDMEDSTFDDLDEFIANAKRAAQLAVPKSDPLPLSTATDDLDLELESESDPSDAIKSEDQKDGEMAAFERMNKSLQTGLLRIRSAKQGIERFEDRFDRYSRAQSADTKPVAPQKKITRTLTQAPKGHAHHNHKSPTEGCPYCKSSSSTGSSTAVTYLHLALPRLFHRTPTFHLTWLGVFTLILSMWYAAESTMCSMYCRPTTCPASKSPCVWSFDDPTDFGTALPIKLDQWITGGQGRQLASFAYEETYDWIADMQDLALGRDATKVDMETLSPEQKRRHRRRLRKKGLVASAREPLPEEKAKWDEWRAARLAKQKAEETRQKGHVVNDEKPKSKPKPADQEEEQGWVKIKGWR